MNAPPHQSRVLVLVPASRWVDRDSDSVVIHNKLISLCLGSRESYEQKWLDNYTHLSAVALLQWKIGCRGYSTAECLPTFYFLGGLRRKKALRRLHL
jgi:hypothetical protein